jgi:penicillin-binding protein A
MAYRDSRRSKLNPILFTIAALLALTWFLIGIPLNRAQSAWLDDEYESALTTLDRWSKLRLRPAEYEHLYAAVHLSRGDRQAAEPYLRGMAGRSPDWFSAIRKETTAEKLIARGRYESFLEYDTAVEQKRERPSLDLYRAAAQLGANRISEAQTTFATIDRRAVDEERFNTLRAAIEQRKSGNFPLVFDREGRTIASYQIANQDLVAVNSSFVAFVDESGGPTSIENHLRAIGTATTIHTTLDPQIQRAAIDALGNRRGSLVAIDPRTHEILAIASTPGEGQARNLAFEGQYEPASVMKPITAITAMESGVDFTGIFPLQCEGFIVIDGRQFFDWAQHAEVPGIDDAMAVSCNVAFGEMGLATGMEPMRQMAAALGFGSSLDLGLYEVGLGQLVGDVRTDFQIATFGVGLDHYLTNALHLAIIASTLANRGVWTDPVLLRARQSILGDVVESGPDSREPRRIASQQTVERVIQSMKAVVTHPAGTGRRAAIEGLDYAMKTGTAGDRSKGFDAVILGFAPAENPSIAFAFIAENVGKAEIEGATVTQSFLRQIRDRLR